MSEVNYTSPTERVETWLDQTTLHIRFNNVAKHNALSVDMWEAVPHLLTQAESDPRVRLVVFSGAGEKAFVSGADISQFEDMRAAKEAVTRYEHMAETALMSIYNFPKPTLACIQGYCIGGGVGVALNCDIRIAASSAKFAESFVRLGITPGDGGAWLLPRIVGFSKATELALTGETIDAAEALRIGLVTQVVDDADLMPAVIKEAQKLGMKVIPWTVNQRADMQRLMDWPMSMAG